MKIALYQSTKYEWMELIMEVNDFNEKNKDHIRISEIKDVTFDMLPTSPKSRVAEMKVAAAQKNFDDAKKKLEALKNG